MKIEQLKPPVVIIRENAAGLVLQRNLNSDWLKTNLLLQVITKGEAFLRLYKRA